MVRSHTFGTWSIIALAVLSLSIGASGCALHDRARGRSMERPSEAELPEEADTVPGVHVQLVAKQKTWEMGTPPILHASVAMDEDAEDDVFLATHVGLGCRVSIDGRWYTHPLGILVAVHYHNIRKISMELKVQLDESWVSMNGGEALSLSKGIHRVQFAWAGYMESEGEQQPLLLLSNEVEIVIMGE